MSMPRRVLVLTADAGFGHRSAANAVAAALRETYGDQCLLEIVNPLDDERTPPMLRGSQLDYDRIVREMPGLYEFGYQASDAPVPTTIVESALTVLLFEVLRDCVRRHQPDAIVSTYPLYQAPLSAVFSITRRSVPLLVAVTDLMTVHRLWFNSGVDLCLVPTTSVHDLAIDSGLPAERVKITGIPVSPDLARGDRDAASTRTELGWREDLTTVLAVGSRRVVSLFDVLRALDHSALPIQLVVVAGGDDELYARLRAVDWHQPTYVYNFVRNLPTMMHAADLVISKAGGLIVTEALACGLPLLLVDTLPGQETGNAAYVVGGEAGERVDSALDALETVYHWLADGGKLLAEREVSARRLGRPRSAFEVAELAWAAAERGPLPKPPLAPLPRLTKLLSHFGVHWQEERSERALPPESSDSIHG
jgi:1,2-diacylglycerol 3-beta-galactosyltransferase